MLGCNSEQPPPAPVTDLTPSVATSPVADDPDDPAVWVHPRDPAESLILGTNKVEGPGGALVVFGLDGTMRQTIGGIDRPNNVDVEYGLWLGGESIDIAVVTERVRSRLRVFRIPADGGALTEVGAIPVFEGESGEAALPMGIGLYKRPADGAIFAIVSRKTGPKEGYLWQYRIEDDGAGSVRGVKVREFGAFSGGDGEIEAVAVDDAAGFVYYADELAGIRKYHADPEAPDAGRELALFGTAGFEGDREGIAVYAREDGTGYIVCTDQLPGNSRYLLFDRRTLELRAVLRVGADSTDGIDATARPLGSRFLRGILAVMNSAGNNFFLAPWPAL